MVPDSQEADPLSVGFRDVDSTGPEKILRCLGTLATMDSVRSYKEAALDRLDLGPASSALDVACGLGDDVARMKARCGRAVGVDGSSRLLDLARSRHPTCEFVRSDAAGLDLPDETFDAVRVDRSLQHIEEPGRVVREMARVARRGGVVLCAEPDWGTFLLGGRRTAVSEAIERHWVASFRNPRIGRDLSGLMAEVGVDQLRWEGHWLPTRGFEQTDILFEVEATARKLVASMPEALPWLEAFRRGPAFAGVLMLVCWGRKS